VQQDPVDFIPVVEEAEPDVLFMGRTFRQQVNMEPQLIPEGPEQRRDGE